MGSRYLKTSDSHFCDVGGKRKLLRQFFKKINRNPFWCSIDDHKWKINIIQMNMDTSLTESLDFTNVEMPKILYICSLSILKPKPINYNGNYRTRLQRISWEMWLVNENSVTFARKKYKSIFVQGELETFLWRLTLVRWIIPGFTPEYSYFVVFINTFFSFIQFSIVLVKIVIWIIFNSVTVNILIRYIFDYTLNCY